MANALFVDALKGYEFYLSKRGKVTLEQINDYLGENRRNPISHRTYTHYHNLIQSGFRSYIPINKFDVFQAIGKIQIAADRRRYQRELVDFVVSYSPDSKNWIMAKIIDQSIVGFGLLIEGKFSAQTGPLGWVRLDGYNDIPVVMVWRHQEDERTMLGVRAMEFIAKYRTQDFEDTIHRPARFLRVRHETGDALDWDNIYGILSKIDEVIKSGADIIYCINDMYDIEIRLRRPVLQSISFNSPGETSIKIDFGVADILRVIFEKVQFWGLQKRKLRAEVDAQELNNQSVALANANLTIETMRNVMKFGKELQDTQLRDDIITGLKKIAPALLGVKKPGKDYFASESPELAILVERLLPAVLDLTAGDDTDFTATIDDKDEKGE